MTLRDALERGVEDIAGCMPFLANVAALLVALCIEWSLSRSSAPGSGRGSVGTAGSVKSHVTEGTNAR